MIIAIDGNVFAGKTTLCRACAESAGVRMIAEHSAFVDRIALEKADGEFGEHARYLRADALRAREVSGDLVFLDRSFVSNSAHIHALQRAGMGDLREKHLALLESLLRKGGIIVPDFYVFLDCSRALSAARFAADQEADSPRPTPEFFLSEAYFAAVNDFNRRWQAGRGDGLILDQAPGAARVLEISSAPTPGRRSTEEIIALTRRILLGEPAS